MKSYYGRRVKIYEYAYRGDARIIGNDSNYLLEDTGKTGHLLEIDVHYEHVMIADEAGNIVKLFYKLVKLI